MEGQGQESTADDLARALERNRARLPEVADLEMRLQRSEAIEQLDRYVSLLRTATADTLARYCFKLEFPDGRWDLVEQERVTPPSSGDVIDVAGVGSWQIRGSQSVRPRPAGKPSWSLFVCAPAV